MRKLNRRALLSTASLAAFAASLPQKAWAGNPWAPTELGIELMRRRWAFAEATYVRVRMVDAEWSRKWRCGRRPAPRISVLFLSAIFSSA